MGGEIMDIKFSKDFIMIDLNETNRDDLFHLVVEKLMKEGVVEEGYEDDLLERESNFPTGLLVGDINVAIPHANHRYVNRSCVVLCRLNKPIEFFRMDEPTEEVSVSLVFFLVLEKSEEHLKMLQNIVEIVQNQDTMKKLITAKNADQILETVSSR